MKSILIFRLSNNEYEITVGSQTSTISTESWDDDAREAIATLYKRQVERTKALLDELFTN